VTIHVTLDRVGDEPRIGQRRGLELHAGPPNRKAVRSMNSKGPSSVDRLPAEAPDSAPVAAQSAADAVATRRRLIGAAGLAGLASAATALVSQTASASTNLPTEGDTALLTAAMQLELSARDLYRHRLDSANDGDLAPVISVMAENHEAFAQAIAGHIGVSANTRNDDVYESLEASFGGSADEFLAAARGLEETAVATHTALLEDYESNDAIVLTASILVIEARHSTVLADVMNIPLDERFVNTGEALDLGGAA